MVRITPMIVTTTLMMAVACGSRPTPAGPSALSSALTSERQTSAGGGGTVKETLTGAAIGGVVPEGQALADMSQFSSGGSTTLTVQIKKVNLPDGIVLQVTFDFQPIGTIELSRSEGTLVTNLGHFGVSRDQVRVNNGDQTILVGGFFQ